MEERFKSFGPGFFSEPPWLAMPEHIKAVMKADFELHSALLKLRRATTEKDIKETASKAEEILKEASGKIEKLIKKDKE